MSEDLTRPHRDVSQSKKTPIGKETRRLSRAYREGGPRPREAYRKGASAYRKANPADAGKLSERRAAVSSHPQNGQFSSRHHALSCSARGRREPGKVRFSQISLVRFGFDAPLASICVICIVFVANYCVENSCIIKLFCCVLT